MFVFRSHNTIFDELCSPLAIDVLYSLTRRSGVSSENSQTGQVGNGISMKRVENGTTTT